MSTLLQRLVMLITTNYSDNAWSDFVVEEAETLIHNLCLDDWPDLKTTINNLSDDALGRLAYALGNASSEHTYPLLIQIIGFQREPVSLGACDSLRAVLQQNKEVI